MNAVFDKYRHKTINKFRPETEFGTRQYIPVFFNYFRII